MKKNNEPEDEGSITLVISQMKSGEMANAEFIFDRFFNRLTHFVRDRMNRQIRTLGNEEDVVLKSLNDLFLGLAEGKFSELSDRDSFWRLLVTVACRNVYDEVNREKRQKRGGGKVVNASALDCDSTTELFERVSSAEDSPHVQIAIREHCQTLLESLSDPQLQVIVVMKMAGYTSDEIRQALGVSLRTVERGLGKIREIWADKVT